MFIIPLSYRKGKSVLNENGNDNKEYIFYWIFGENKLLEDVNAQWFHGSSWTDTELYLSFAFIIFLSMKLAFIQFFRKFKFYFNDNTYYGQCKDIKEWPSGINT